MTAGVTIDTARSKIKIHIITAAEEATDKRKIYSRNKNLYCGDISSTSATKQMNSQQYVAVRNRADAKITQIKKDYWKKFSTDMQHDLYNEEYETSLDRGRNQLMNKSQQHYKQNRDQNDNLKNIKSRGPDKITNEMLKYRGDELMTELFHFHSMIGRPGMEI